MGKAKIETPLRSSRMIAAKFETPLKRPQAFADREFSTGKWELAAKSKRQGSLTKSNR